jgi:hypothetical protein
MLDGTIWGSIALIPWKMDFDKYASAIGTWSGKYPEPVAREFVTWLDREVVGAPTSAWLPSIEDVAVESRRGMGRIALSAYDILVFVSTFPSVTAALARHVTRYFNLSREQTSLELDLQPTFRRVLTTRAWPEGLSALAGVTADGNEVRLVASSKRPTAQFDDLTVTALFFSVYGVNLKLFRNFSMHIDPQTAKPAEIQDALDYVVKANLEFSNIELKLHHVSYS